MRNWSLFIFITFLSILLSCSDAISRKIIPGAEQPDQYLPFLKDKNVGLVVNQTSNNGDNHLVDFLLENQILVKKIFAPEHGFRGEAPAGEEFENGVDTKTGLPIVSIYGKNRKPKAEDLLDIDVMIFDIQDVGCRFFTYISTLHYVIEACAENGVQLLILDRPNPNGDYIDGPILKKEFRSFVGMDPIPIVHGCSVGELAQMINGEMWHDAKMKCNLTVIPMKNYDHTTPYSLPIKPSPNLPNDLSIRLYPSLCLFEATSISIGRGTGFPFQVIGYPDQRFGKFSFTPEIIHGVALNPIQEGETCYGDDFRNLENPPRFTLKYFLDYYNRFENEEEFLTRERWFNQLIGNDNVLKQIREGRTEEEIKKSWEEELRIFKEMRKKYLLYPDFE